MATMSKKQEPIFIGEDDKIIELKGDALETFLAEQEQRKKEYQLLETEYKAKQKAREDAIKKLAEVAGLTEAELNAIL
jgi:predicted Holliday junction resolvase-like endonuclease